MRTLHPQYKKRQQLMLQVAFTFHKFRQWSTLEFLFVPKKATWEGQEKEHHAEKEKNNTCEDKIAHGEVENYAQQWPISTGRNSINLKKKEGFVYPANNTAYCTIVWAT